MIKIKNIPNILTFSRIILCPIWFLLVLYNYHFSAFILIIYISLTDYFDGLIARKLNALSRLGKILDPIADKIFISTVLITFVSDARANLVLSIIIISRELVISCLREVLSEQNKSNILKVSLISKTKTSFQFISIIILSSIPLIKEYAISLETIGNTFLLLTAILSIYSAYKYVILAFRQV